MPRPQLSRRCVWNIALGLVASIGFSASPWAAPCCMAQDAPPRPNIILILADDLGYGDLGCYGQQVIQTPRLDQMAAEGMRFTQFYAGSTVCAPSRSVLMTGLHMGHTPVRGNAGGAHLERQSLRDQDVTMAEVLAEAGYATGLIGKWGLGEIDMEGHPLRQGFDSFYGYLNQQHAHNYYPEFLWRDREKEPLGNVVQGLGGDRPHLDFTPGAATRRVDYSHDLFAQEALEYVRQHQDERFFLYLALTMPHANNEGTRLTGDGAEVPDYGPYANEDWPAQDKGQAAMITRMDTDVGRLLDLLVELDLDRETLVIFTSDNGPHDEAGHDLDRFDPNGPLRGIKRSLYEGGIRVPAIFWMPGTIPAASSSDHIAYAGDLFATAADLAGAAVPPGLDSLSLVPTLTGNASAQAEHPYLYWEFYEQGSRQAVRFERWKAIRQPMRTGPVELFDLQNDLGERHDVAEEHPEIVRRATRFLEEAHQPHPNWIVAGS